MTTAPESSKQAVSHPADNSRLPPLNLLGSPEAKATPAESKEALASKARMIQQALAHFGMNVELGGITPGPTVTRYELIPAPGVDLEAILRLSRNLTAALKAENIHIIAPVPRKGTVGIEVPNASRTDVCLREIFESDEWRNTPAYLPLALGKDIDGRLIVADLAELPHLLIAGRTGSGKSVCLHALITSLLCRFSPDLVRLVMIDTQVTDLISYNVLPHLVAPVVTDSRKALLALRWVLNEIESRHQIFARVGTRNLKFFNERSSSRQASKPQPAQTRSAKKKKLETRLAGLAMEVDSGITHLSEDEVFIPEKLAPMIVIINELADLMAAALGDFEKVLAQILQMGRAVGIHCIIGTQRPEVDVITGVIKANIPARIAFQVASRADSRTILDALGAEKLLGKGDLLYLAAGDASLQRAQGALITESESQNVLNFFAGGTANP